MPYMSFSNVTPWRWMWILPETWSSAIIQHLVQFVGYNHIYMSLIIHFHLLLRLRMCGATRLVLHLAFKLLFLTVHSDNYTCIRTRRHWNQKLMANTSVQRQFLSACCCFSNTTAVDLKGHGILSIFVNHRQQRSLTTYWNSGLLFWCCYLHMCD